MTRARPLADDPVLLGRQRQLAALKVVGSGVDASQTGTGKCVAPDTPILISGRWLPAQDVWERNAGRSWQADNGEWAEPNEPLWTASLSDDGRMTSGRVRALYRQRVHERGRRVTLTDGSQLITTTAHALHGADGWSRAIGVGDTVTVPAHVPWNGPDHHPAVIELLAWQIAEGYEPRTSATTAVARIYQRDERILRHLRSRAEEIEQTMGIRMGKLPIYCRPPRVAHLCIGSRQWRRYLEALGYRWGALAAEKRVPDDIVAASNPTVALFLRCYIDAEGSISQKRRMLEITSASKAIVNQIAVMLRRFGVWMRIKHRLKAATNGAGIRRDYWTGYVSGPSLRRFAQHIGCGTSAHRDALAAACRGRCNPNHEVVPVHDILAELQAVGVPQRWMLPDGFENVRARGVSCHRAVAIADAILKVSSRAAARRRGPVSDRQRATVLALTPELLHNASERLRRRADRDVFYARVASVEEVLLDGWVYDFSIEEHHNFVAGGMLAHNTITSGRALAHRAATTPRLRAMVVAEGRLLAQWRDELLARSTRPRAAAAGP